MANPRRIPIAFASLVLPLIAGLSDALFEIERTLNGQSAEKRKAVRQELSAPLVAELPAYMIEQRTKLSRGHDLSKAMSYLLKRWASFTLFLDADRVCLGTTAAERALTGISLGLKSFLFSISDPRC